MNKTDLFPLNTHNKPHVDKLLKDAAAFNAKMDSADRKMGFRTPSDGLMSEALRTAMLAIASSMTLQRWDSAAEGLLMVQEVELALRKHGM